jgi:hypothetical protein
MEADFGLTEMALDERNRHKGDDHLFVNFFSHPMQNKEKSLAEGRPIFEDTEYLSIMIPGDKDNIVTRAVRPGDKERFPVQWAAFQNNNQELLEGTPLTEWPLISAAQREEMKHFNIRTVEQLANVSDGTSQKFMGIQVLKKRAKEYLEVAKEAAPLSALQGELNKRDEEISSLSATVEAMQKELASLKKGKAKK